MDKDGESVGRFEESDSDAEMTSMLDEIQSLETEERRLQILQEEALRRKLEAKKRKVKDLKKGKPCYVFSKEKSDVDIDQLRQLPDLKSAVSKQKLGLTVALSDSSSDTSSDVISDSSFSDDSAKIKQLHSKKGKREREIISNTTTSAKEGTGRLFLLKRIMYLNAHFTFQNLKAFYAALGEKNWGDDFHYLETCILNKPYPSSVKPGQGSNPRIKSSKYSGIVLLLMRTSLRQMFGFVPFFKKINGQFQLSNNLELEYVPIDLFVQLPAKHHTNRQLKPGPMPYVSGRIPLEIGKACHGHIRAQVRYQHPQLRAHKF
ncbi:hypothetical protein MAR_013053 [Mya arenaria]|uniref:Uncharacterized protein n=1 Tax=Mya arenaria TaxID=6604 RepID=A0ABY7G277_MYAAR|nr:hypothetical protein MAR_013053 [Mya arenaria]